MSGQPYVFVTLPPGKVPSPHYPLNRGLSGLQPHLDLWWRGTLYLCWELNVRSPSL